MTTSTAPPVSRLTATRALWGRFRWIDRFVIAVLVALIVIAALAEVVSPYGVSEFAGPPAQPPSGKFLLGTDEVGRDVVTRVIFGSRTTLFVGVVSTVIATIVGVPMGLISGYFGGKIDSVIMRVTDGLLAFPPIILAVVLVAVLEPSLNNAIIAIGIVQIPRFARMVRAVTMSVRQQEFVLAAEAIGGSDFYIMRRTIMPNVLTVVLVQATLAFATAVLTEAGLSFLGLGAQPPEASWGLLLNSGRTLLSLNPGMAIGAGGAIFLAVLVFALLGDVVADLSDPNR